MECTPIIFLKNYLNLSFTFIMWERVKSNGKQDGGLSI
jgi:hypothetical protein